MNGKLTEGPEENRCSPGGLMHAAAKATWPGDAHDQDASTGSSQVPSRNHSKNLTKNHSKEPHGTTVKNNKKGGTKKFNQILSKPPWFIPRICTGEIRLATNLSPRNRRLGLIQTPGKIQIVDKNGFFSSKAKTGSIYELVPN